MPQSETALLSVEDLTQSEKVKAELHQYLEKGLASGAGRPAFVVFKELRRKYQSSKTRF